jgi:tetratricopeptide (TPR) repeat protein
VGGGGHCKHAAALLLTWLHEPDLFVEVDDLITGLEQRSKSELVALILKMIRRYPELETLFELPIAGDPDSSNLIDPDLIRRQVNVAFTGAWNDWGAASRTSQELLDILELGDEYAQHKNWRNAATVYEIVARSVLDLYDQVYDGEGQVGNVVYHCTEGLARCLEAVDDSAQREALLQALFDIYRWDVDAGGYGIGEDVPDHILAQANAKERRKVSEWVQKALPNGNSWSDDYHRREYGGLMLELLKTDLDDESFLQICRETGRQHDLVDRLLTLNRVDEAVIETRGAGDYDLLQLVDLYAMHDQADLGEQLIRERVKTSQDSRLVAWLMDTAEERGDLADALSFAEVLFWQRPSPPAYEKMERLARRLGRWDPVREMCINRLRDAGEYAVLTRIFILEDRVDQALITLEQLHRQSRWGVANLSI